MNTASAWIRDNAHRLDDQGPVLAAAKAAAVVAIGENTRESAEIDHRRVELTKALVAEAGYRIIVIPDSANVAERMDDYVHGRRSDLSEVVLSAWAPNRTQATADLLQWIREFNEDHPGVHVRIIGNGAKQPEPRDYDQVVAYAEPADATAAERIREHYDVIRTAHEVGEHIQIHQGTHPGRPFAGLADEAFALVQGLPDGQGKAAVVARADLIRSYHRNSFAAKPDIGAISKDIADIITAAQAEIGQKIVYFDGFALTGVLGDVEVAVNPGKPFANPGRLLRDRFGDRYVSVLLAFGRGTIRGDMAIPEAGDGYVERALADSGAGDVLLSLRDSCDGAWPSGAFKLRIIAGIYDPDEDDKHGIELPSLRESADFLGFVRSISPTPPLEA